MKVHEIGGAVVRRRFTHGPRTMQIGEILTAMQCREIPVANFNALVTQKKLELYPMVAANPNAKRYAIHMGMGRWDVIEGNKLNAEPLSREEAEAMLPKDERPGRRGNPKKRAKGKGEA